MATQLSLKNNYAIEFFLRGFYFSVKTILIYIMIDRSFADFTQASQFLALFSSIYLLSPLIGSTVTDKFLGFQMGLAVGIVLNLCAGALFLLPSQSALFLSLACLLVSGGLTKGTIVCLVSQNYDKNSGGFVYIILHAVVNISAFLLPNSLGMLGESFGWATAQVTGLALCIPPLFLLRLKRAEFRPKPIGLLWVMVNVGIFYMSFLFWDYLKGAVSIYGILLFIGILITSFNVRVKIGLLVIMMLTGFYTGFAEMIFFDLNKDIFTRMNRWIGDFQVPAAWFMTARAFFIFFIGICIAKWQKRPQHFSKEWLLKRVSLSFLLLGVSFILHQVGLFINGTFVGLSMGLMACGFLLNAFAEIIIVPEAVGFVASHASLQTRARTIGLLYAMLALGVLCAPLINRTLLCLPKAVNILPNTTPYIHLSLALFFLALMSYTGKVVYERMEK